MIGAQRSTPVSWPYGYIGEPTVGDAVLDRLLQGAHRLDVPR